MAYLRGVQPVPTDEHHADLLTHNTKPLLPIPLRADRLLHRMANITAFCVVDEPAACDRHLCAEEIFLPKGNSHDEGEVLDLGRVDEDSSPYRVRFEDPNWHDHLASLKPLCLTSMMCLNAGESPPLLRAPRAPLMASVGGGSAAAAVAAAAAAAAKGISADGAVGGALHRRRTVAAGEQKKKKGGGPPLSGVIRPLSTPLSAKGSAKGSASFVTPSATAPFGATGASLAAPPPSPNTSSDMLAVSLLCRSKHDSAQHMWNFASEVGFRPSDLATFTLRQRVHIISLALMRRQLRQTDLENGDHDQAKYSDAGGSGAGMMGGDSPGAPSPGGGVGTDSTDGGGACGGQKHVSTSPLPSLQDHMSSVIVHDKRSRRLQLMSAGEVDLVLPMCQEFWGGDSIWPLSPACRRKIRALR